MSDIVERLKAILAGPFNIPHFRTISACDLVSAIAEIERKDAEIERLRKICALGAKGLRGPYASMIDIAKLLDSAAASETERPG